MKKHFILDLDGTVLDSYVKKEPYKNAARVLTKLKSIANLSLVTAGDSDVQWEKIKKHDLERFFFPIVVVKEKFRKFDALSWFVPGNGIVDGSASRTDVIVVGDRIEYEIAYGRMLGYTTVRILQGPHQVHKPKHSHEQADIEISELYELISLAKKGRN